MSVLIFTLYAIVGTVLHLRVVRPLFFKKESS